MALPPNFVSNFASNVYNLFIPGKATKEVDQPGYGTDLRTIENWAANLILGLRNGFITLINAIDQSAIDYGANWLVGSAPPATGVRWTDQSFVAFVSFTSGLGMIPVTGFSHGYNAIVCNAISGGYGSSTVVSVDYVNSTLTELHLGAIEFSGSPLTGGQAVSVRIVGA